MKCSDVRASLSQINHHGEFEPAIPIPLAGIDYLSANDYILRTNKDDYNKGVHDVARLSQMTVQMNAEKTEEEQAAATLQKDEQKEHSFSFHFEGTEAKDELSRRIQDERAVVSKEESELITIEANVNELIQKKSTIDRMVPYGDGYLSLTGLGSLVLNDLDVRNYRVADEEFSDFLTEFKATYAELRSIADKAASYVILLKPKIPNIEDEEHPDIENEGHPAIEAPSLLWSTAIGLAKLQGDTNQIGERFIQAFDGLENFDSTTPNKLMAAEIMTAANQDLQSLESDLRSFDKQVRDQGVPRNYQPA